VGSLPADGAHALCPLAGETSAAMMATLETDFYGVERTRRNIRRRRISIRDYPATSNISAGAG
jgi:hypothetical protein